MFAKLSYYSNSFLICVGDVCMVDKGNTEGVLNIHLKGTGMIIRTTMSIDEVHKALYNGVTGVKP